MDAFLFDCDGVLWNSYGAIPGAVELIKKLRESNKRMFFVTNNSTKSREDLAKNFTKHGFEVKPEELLGTAYLAALYLKNTVKVPEDKKVYVIGSPGMATELESEGIHHIGIGQQPPRDDPNVHYALNFDTTRDPDVCAVLVGYDQHFNLNKISQAMQYLNDPSIPFVATNADNSYPVGKGVFTPGTGCIVRAVETSVSREATVIGKPNRLMFDIVAGMYGLDPRRTLMTGDRLNTDVLFGKNCGVNTLCVLSGVTNEEHIQQLPTDSPMMPDMVVQSVVDLI